MRDIARRNCHWYARSAEEVFGAAHQRIPSRASDGWHECNPSVFEQQKELLVNARQVNYTIQEDGSYEHPGYIQTKNRLEVLAGKYPTENYLLNYLSRGCRTDARIQGMEDVRPFIGRGGFGFVCTVADMAEDGQPKQAVCWPGTGTLMVQQHGGEVEKNWLPFVDNVTGNLRFLYSTDPTVWLIGGREGQLVPAAEYTPKAALDHLRGSSQVIPFLSGRLYLAHEVTQFKRRSYLHRFVHTDQHGEVDGLTEPFYWQRQRDIEFAAGLCWYSQDGLLYASYGVLDKEAWVATIEPSAIRAALRRVGGVRNAQRQ